MSANSMSYRIPCSWANLPSDLLLSIENTLDVTTSIRLSAVCTSWASTIRPCLPSFPPLGCDQPIPWLLCSAQNSDTNPNSSVLTFYDLRTAAYFSVRIPIPSLCTHHWLGSHKGWLVTLDQQKQLHLIKPLTGDHVLLPSKGIEKVQPKKVIMWHNPDSNATELQAFCLTQQGGLLSAKVRDESWTCMIDFDRYTDIAIYQGKFYAVSRHLLTYWNLGNSSTEHTVMIASQYRSGWTKYLLEWNGELVVLKIDKEERVNLENHTPKKVKLYKIKFMRDYICSLSRVRSLKDDVLFFGADFSYTVSSSGRDDIRGNCIYFIHQMSRFSHDAEFGAFDLETKIYYKPCCEQDSAMHWPPPIWFWPSNYEDRRHSEGLRHLDHILIKLNWVCSTKNIWFYLTVFPLFVFIFCFLFGWYSGTV